MSVLKLRTNFRLCFTCSFFHSRISLPPRKWGFTLAKTGTGVYPFSGFLTLGGLIKLKKELRYFLLDYFMIKGGYHGRAD